MEVNDRNGRIVATFPVGLTDGVMLVSDGGQVIRTSVKDVRIAGRRTQGVTLFKVAPDEHVVSVARIDEESGNGDDSGNNDGDDGQAEADTSSLPLE
jgi:DNA gyrase subunit A